ncbi:MAG: hypothetical protein HYV09_15870 [Deltaproteobacteria bacterium]|nr:hypothetical protein [Deltaproteobacteria bacterium]
MKLSVVAGISLLVAACGGQKVRTQHPIVALSREAREAQEARTAAARAETTQELLASLQGAELRVRLNQDLGPGLSPPDDPFTAKLVAPIVDRRGFVVVPPGALVHGRVIHVDEPSRRVEVKFERLETRDGVFQLNATIIAATPWALTVRPEGVPTSTSAVLQGVAPSAIGGGPLPPESEAEEDAPRGTAIIPFDAELRLKVLSAQ